MNEQVYDDEATEVIFSSDDGGVSLSSECPSENHVIVRKYFLVSLLLLNEQLHCHKFQLIVSPNHSKKLSQIAGSIKW